MNINGWDVLVERGSWVDDNLLYSESLYEDVLARLKLLTENPNHFSYLQRSPLNKFRRIRMDHHRLYARFHVEQKVLAILAFAHGRTLKRAETAGSLDFDFQAYVLQHEEFRPERFTAFERKERKKQKDWPYEPPEPEKPILSWSLRIQCRSLSEQEADSLLRGCKKAAPSDPYLLTALRKVEKALPDDRIIYPLPDGAEMWERPKINELKRQLTRTLHFYNQTFTVHFDEISRKFLICQPDRLKMYCYGTAANNRHHSATL